MSVKRQCSGLWKLVFVVFFLASFSTVSDGGSAVAGEAGRELVFVDAALGLHLAPTDGMSQRVVYLEGEKSPWSRMAEELRKESDLKAVHLMTHGAPGALLLGSTPLDGAGVEKFLSPLEAIRNALAPDGDLLLYGCRVGAGEGGKRWEQFWPS